MIDITLGMWIGRALGRQRTHNRLKEKDMRSGTTSVTRQEAAILLTCRRGSEATNKDGEQMAAVITSD